jgi:hypothetical protein
VDAPDFLRVVFDPKQQDAAGRIGERDESFQDAFRRR